MYKIIIIFFLYFSSILSVFNGYFFFNIVEADLGAASQLFNRKETIGTQSKSK